MRDFHVVGKMCCIPAPSRSSHDRVVFSSFFISTNSKLKYSRQELIIMVADSKICSDVMQFAADSDGRHSVSRQVSPLHTRVSFFWNGFNLSRPYTVNKENGNLHVWTWQ
jgi:hypothetical protein